MILLNTKPTLNHPRLKLLFLNLLLKLTRLIDFFNFLLVVEVPLAFYDIGFVIVVILLCGELFDNVVVPTSLLR